MKTVIEMAGKVDAVTKVLLDRKEPQGMSHDVFVRFLEHFAELVRADERNSWPAEMEAMERQVNILTDSLAQAKADEAAKYKWDIHSCGPDCQRYACVSMREAVAAERERWREVESYIIAASDGSMSRNNSQNLAAELLAAIRGG